MEEKKHIDVKIEITGSNCKRKPNHGKTAISFALMGIVFGGIPYIGVAYILLCFVLVIRAFRQDFSMEAFCALIIVAVLAFVKYFIITTF